jgi:polar amino acid transport system substrate-binding protein
MTQSVFSAVRAELAPSSALRVGLNMSNFLLVKEPLEIAEPTGIAPDIGRELARRLDVPVLFVKYPGPGELAAAAPTGEWDVGLIGADPLRAAEIVFTPAYLEIEATYMVFADSPIHMIQDVDRPGIRIAVADKTAYDMYLRRTLKHATLHRASGIDGSYQLFLRERLDVLAGLKPRLVLDQQKHPGSRILEGSFTSIQQAIGTPIIRTAAAAFLRKFVDEIKAGLVAQLIAKHDVRGVTVAPRST